MKVCYDERGVPSNQYIQSGHNFSQLLSRVDFVAEKIFPLSRGFTNFYMEGVSIEIIPELIKLVNKTMGKRIEEAVGSKKKFSQQEVFEYKSYTMKTSVALLDNHMLDIPEDLSYQLSIGRPRTRCTQTMDSNYRNHVIFIYINLIQNRVLRDTRALLRRQMALDRHSNLHTRPQFALRGTWDS